jgi:hypothetical protein
MCYHDLIGGRVVTIEEQVVATLRTLPPEGQREVLELIERWRDRSQQDGPRSPAPDWPPGLFERTAGAWQGEPLVREPEGEVDPGGRMADLLEQLAAIQALPDLTDPARWERDLRQDRELPGREL